MSDKELSFEESLTELQEIIRKMESGQCSLEESIQEFKKGTELIKHCDQILDNYEKMITAVTPAEDGVKEVEL